MSDEPVNQTLHGTCWASNAAEAEAKAREAAGAYFGERSFRLTIIVREIRTIGDRVVGFEVDYTAEERTVGPKVRVFRAF
jgi:hypothetical protein